MRRLWVLGLILITSIFLISPISKMAAQVPGLSIDLAIEMSPLNPNPGDKVSLKATSYSVDLSQLNIVWNYNGKVVASGIGKNQISIIAPAAGTTGIINATVNGMGLTSGSAVIYLRPASVDLLWEATDAYTPPFYKGKALLPPGGTIKISAIPSASAPKNLTYNWSRNGSVLGNASGFNKNSLTIKQDTLDNQERINLDIKGGAFSGSSSTNLTASDPILLAYKKNEGFIDYANGFDKTIFINTSGVILHFDPYYFSIPNSLKNDLTFNTFLNNQQVYPDQPNEISISKADAVSVNIRMDIMTTAYSLQNIDKSFSLSFK